MTTLKDSSLFDPLKGLNEQQKRACTCECNMLLTACPGSGKTKTIVHRLAYYSIKYASSRKLNIAITYTNRASDEMEKRLSLMGIESENIWTGTIHQFCMNYIIRPYSMYSDRLRYGYRIIDENEQNTYCHQIAEDNNITIQYDKYLENEFIKQKYKELLIEKHEIDFNDILEISRDMLKSHNFITDNISRLFRSINIDEYQDTNAFQYEILSLLHSKQQEINLAFVGDANQAIYSKLGGIAKTKDELEALFDTHFEELFLSGCYRSTQTIIDFYSKFAERPISIDSLVKEKVISTIKYDHSISKDNLSDSISTIISEQLEKGVDPSEICVLAPQWYLLYPIANDLRRLLPEVPFDAPNITPFKYDLMNPFYLLAWLLFSNNRNRERLRKKRASDFISILKNDYNVTIDSKIDIIDLINFLNRERRLFTGTDGIKLLDDTIKKTLKMLHITLDGNIKLKQCYSDYFDLIHKRIKDHGLSSSPDDLTKCFQDKHGVVVATIHSVKGEEYKTVIALGLLYGYIPNWNSILDKKIDENAEAKRLLYVLFSRAKKDIFYFSETGTTRNRGMELIPTQLLLSGK